MLKRLIQLFTRQNRGKNYPVFEAALKLQRPKKLYPKKPQAIAEANSNVFRFQTWDRPTRLEFYRFMRDHVPILNSVVWTWKRLCAAPNRLEITGDATAGQKKKAQKLLRALDERLYQFPFARFGGTDAVLAQFFNSLFTLGAVAGEIVLNASRTQIEKFFFIDPATLGLVWDKSDNCNIFQESEISARTTQCKGEYLLGEGHDFINFDEAAFDPVGEYVAEKVLALRLADRGGEFWISPPRPKAKIGFTAGRNN